MSEHPYGWLSLLPPLAAIVLAIATRRVLLSLLTGTLLGAMVLSGGHLGQAVTGWLVDHLWTSLSDPDHLRVFAFTLMMGAMVGVIYDAGGMHGVVRSLAPLARGRRSGQLTTWLLGLVVFFDDYANTLLLGGTMQPLADRLRISREKLAYLVDSTAAPVAGLAIVSTWVAGEIGFIQAGFSDLGQENQRVDGFAIFVATIPYRFYVLWALAFVPLIAILGRDFGPMLSAERRALRGNSDVRDTTRRTSKGPVPLDDDLPRRWHNALLPIAVVIGVTFWVLFQTGSQPLDAANAIGPDWLNRIGHGNSYVALVCGSASGLLSALGWVALQRLRSVRQECVAAIWGARQMVQALAILWLAWALSAMTGQQYLQTGGFLAGLLAQSTAPAWLPTAVFILAALVAFATGTSWGTMGILMPLVIRVAHQLLTTDTGTTIDPQDPLMIASIGSVLAGAIFGDHCSPISDTTVLSSQASGCDHVAHVRTQLPYALVVAVISIALGTIPVGFGLSVWLSLPLGVVALAAAIRLFGRRAESS